MNAKEKEVAKIILEMAMDELGNNGCNDVDESIYKDWTKEERIEFMKKFHEWNGDPEEFDERMLHIPDYALVGFLTDRLLSSEEYDSMIKEINARMIMFPTDKESLAFNSGLSWCVDMIRRYKEGKGFLQ